MRTNFTIERTPEPYLPPYAVTYGSARRSVREEGFLNTVARAISTPIDTIERVVLDRPVAWAFLLLVITGLLAGAVQGSSVVTGEFFETYLIHTSVTQELANAFGLSIFIAMPFVMIAAVAAAAAVYWVMSFALGGRGPYSGLFTGFSFAMAPVLAVGVPLTALTYFAGTFGEIASFLGGVALFFWWLALAGVAIGRNNEFTIARATVATLTPVVILGAVYLAFIIILVAVATTQL